MAERNFSETIAILKRAGLRATRQRIALAHLIFGNGNRHITADSLYREALKKRLRLSGATIYNTLRHLTEAKLLREIVIDSKRRHFDTNLNAHHHFYNVDTNELNDIPHDEIMISKMPRLPNGSKVERADIIIRITKR